MSAPVSDQVELAGEQELTGAPTAASWSTNSAAVQRRLRQSLCAFLALGALLTTVNMHYPLARNALNYAKAALLILQYHFDLFAVVRDPIGSGGKPIFFSVLAAPFVSFTNAVTGTLIASALGTAFFLYSVTLALPRLNLRAGLDTRFASLEFAFVAFNPLVLYQFWSGYPDALFAGFAMLGFVLIDIIATEPKRDTRPHIIGLGFTICLAMMTKLYGAILVITCLLYLLLYARKFISCDTHLRSKSALLGGVLVAVVLMLVTAKLQLNPLLRPEGASGFNGYNLGMALPNTKDGLWMLLFALLLSFQFAWLLPMLSCSGRGWPIAPVLFCTAYVAGLLPFSGTGYNMRYFLPVLPFVAPALANGAQSIAPSIRMAVLGVYGIIGAIFILNFNVAFVEEALRPITSRLYSQNPNLVDWLDNLRLPAQAEIKKQIDAINADIPSRGILYWSSDYYGVATHGLAHYLGVRGDIDVRYVLEPSDVPESSVPVFLTLFTASEPPVGFWPSPKGSTVRPLGHGVFRLDPVAVDLHSTSGDSVSESGPVRLEVRLVSRNGVHLRNPMIVDGKTNFQLESAMLSDTALSNPSLGRHEYVAQATYGKGEITESAPVVVYVGISALERHANSAEDLLDEFGDGAAIVPKDTLYLDEGERAIGVRFEDIRVAQGSHIAEAFLKLTSANAVVGAATTVQLQGELSATAAPLRSIVGSVSKRSLTRRSIAWRLHDWPSAGNQERSPNLAPLLDEIFAQEDWKPGNAVLLVLRATGQARLLKVTPQTESPSLYIRIR